MELAQIRDLAQRSLALQDASSWNNMLVAKTMLAALDT